MDCLQGRKSQQQSSTTSVEGAPLAPQPPEGEDEVLPDRELNLDGLVPTSTGEALHKISEAIRAAQASSEALPHELGSVQAPCQ